MRELLVINPNTSLSVSELLQRHVQMEAGAHVRVRTVTARFGVPYIADEAGYAIASHSALDAWAVAIGRSPPSAVLIGCFGDPGLLALRDSSPVPVTGLAEAAFIEASRHGRFAVVTGGERWAPMLQRLAHALGHSPLLAGIQTMRQTGAELARDPAAAAVVLAEACRAARKAFDPRAIVIGGAGLAGIAAAIQPGIDVPLIDSVLAGARCALNGDGPKPSRKAAGFDVRWVNVSPELAALGAQDPAS